MSIRIIILFYYNIEYLDVNVIADKTKHNKSSEFEMVFNSTYN